jgi:hypothetical protein
LTKDGNAEETRAHTCMLTFERKEATDKYPSPESVIHIWKNLWNGFMTLSIKLYITLQCFGALNIADKGMSSSHGALFWSSLRNHSFVQVEKEQNQGTHMLRCMLRCIGKRSLISTLFPTVLFTSRRISVIILLTLLSYCNQDHHLQNSCNGCNSTSSFPRRFVCKLFCNFRHCATIKTIPKQ